MGGGAGVVVRVGGWRGCELVAVELVACGEVGLVGVVEQAVARCGRPCRVGEVKQVADFSELRLAEGHADLIRVW